tara:strand:+ start:502 stop:681 length:180 start_codon:yes stop_codon:yes gene_type:complete
MVSVVFEEDKKWDVLLKNDLCFQCKSKLTTIKDNDEVKERMCKVCGVLIKDTKKSISED